VKREVQGENPQGKKFEGKKKTISLQGKGSPTREGGEDLSGVHTQ